MEQEPRKPAQTEVTGADAATVDTAGGEAAEHQRFTSKGQIPGVAPMQDGPPAPSASERAFDGAGLQANEFFSGPDAGITEQVPPTADKSDADYEKEKGIAKAVEDKTMLPVAGVHGKTFTAKGCAGKKDGKVAFTFDRAYVGDHNSATAGKNVRGCHVSIAVALSGCGEHKDVKLVQVLRNFEKKDGKVVNAEPPTAKRKERSGWDDPKAKSRGWRIDEMDKGTSPHYITSDFYGNDATSDKAGKLRDTPFDWTSDRNVGKEFRTCAVSYSGGKGTVLACVDWGYYIDDKGAASFYPAVPTAYTGSVTELDDAAARWDAIAGNTKVDLKK